MLILFKKYDLKVLSDNILDDFVVHAHPACQALNISGAKEYYLEGYGVPSDGLTKITMGDIVSTMKSQERIDLL